MKFSVAHPNPGKRSTENFTKISRQISRHLWQRKTEKNFTSALLQGSCPDTWAKNGRKRAKHLQKLPKQGGFRFTTKAQRLYTSDILFPYRSPSPRPHPDPTQHPEADPKQTRNRAETEPNGAKSSRNGAKRSRNQASRGGTGGGFVGVGGGGGFPEGPARQIDVSRQKLSPHCLEAIFDSQLPSPKLSPQMPPKLSLPHKRGLFILFQN